MTAHTEDVPAASGSGGATHLSDLAARLRTEVRGPVLLPDDHDYRAELAAFDVGLRHRPDLVVGATCAADVAAATVAAGGLALSVLGTAHAPAPEIRGGITVTTRRMSHVTVDPTRGIATVAAGTTWGQVVDAAAAHGLAAVCGSAPGVGAVGMTLGGGLGPLGRTFGFSADHVAAFELVGADGVSRHVTADTDSDLFWALRGGKRPLGIVTGMTIDLHRLTSFYGGHLMFAGPDIAALVLGYQRWLGHGEIPDELTTSVALLRLPDLPGLPPALRGRTVGALRIGYVGNAAAGAAAVDPLLTAVGCAPVAGSLDQLPYQEIGSVHGDPTHPVNHQSAGLLLTGFDERAAQALLRLAGPGVSVPLAIVEIRHLGGAYARGSAGAVSGRDAAFNVWVSSTPLPESGPTEGVLAVHRAVRSVIDGLEPWSHGCAQVNFTGTENTASERAHAFSAQQTAQLDDICRRHALIS